MIEDSLSARARLRDQLDAIPELWIFAPVLVAGALMLPHAFAPTAACHQSSVGADFFYWMAMVVAMMLPLMATSVRWTADRSLRRRQYRAMIEFVIGYLVPWALAGCGVAWLLGIRTLHAPAAPAIAFALAGLYSLTPFQQSLRTARHSVIPLAPTGWRADWDCVRLGIFQGAPCTASCFLLMAGCTLSGHGFVAMVGGVLIGASELRASRRNDSYAFAGCIALAVWYGIRAYLH